MSRPRTVLLVMALALVVGLPGAREVPPAAGEPIAKRGSVDGRAYRLYVPSVVGESPGDGPERPLVIALHGCWQTPEDFVMTARLGVNLACAAPDVVSGVGVVSGGPYRRGLGALGAMFAKLDGASVAKAEPAGPLLYRDPAGRPLVQAWLIEGMGHAILDFLLGRG